MKTFALIGFPAEVMPYQARVIMERIQLADKVNKLEDFILSEGFQAINGEEQELLTQQLEHMAMYLRVLNIRVQAFNGAKRYTCHKEVMARSMTVGAYNALQGWDIPVDQDPATEGYLVEYLDGGEANHPDFAGYISWSPKDVFERGYSETA
jgi:hypothetical protein